MNSLTTRMIKTLVMIGLFTGSAMAGSFSKSARGTSSAQFLKFPTGARETALGGAVTALSGDAGALAWNPAGLADVKKNNALLSHSIGVEKTASSQGYYAHRTEQGTWGVGVSYFSPGTLDQTNFNGQTTGNFSPADWAGFLGYAHKWGNGSFGVAGKYIQSKIIASDSTLALDAGFLSPKFLGDRWQWGTALKNLGGDLKVGPTANPLPLTLATGLSFSILKGLTALADLDFPRDNTPITSIGFEGEIVPATEWELAYRAGWNSGVSRDLGGFAGLSTGLGLAHNGWTVDYAFSPLGDLGDTHRFSLSLDF